MLVSCLSAFFTRHNIKCSPSVQMQCRRTLICFDPAHEMGGSTITPPCKQRPCKVIRGTGRHALLRQAALFWRGCGALCSPASPSRGKYLSFCVGSYFTHGYFVRPSPCGQAKSGGEPKGIVSVVVVVGVAVGVDIAEVGGVGGIRRTGPPVAGNTMTRFQRYTHL